MNGLHRDIRVLIVDDHDLFEERAVFSARGRGVRGHGRVRWPWRAPAARGLPARRGRDGHGHAGDDRRRGDAARARGGARSLGPDAHDRHGRRAGARRRSSRSVRLPAQGRAARRDRRGRARGRRQATPRSPRASRARCCTVGARFRPLPAPALDPPAARTCPRASWTCSAWSWRAATTRRSRQRLYLSPSTVKNHVSRLLDKLGVDNRVQAATLAVRKTSSAWTERSSQRRSARRRGGRTARGSR